MIFKFRLCFVLYIFFFLASETLAIENRILFKINSEIVTSVDMLEETKYLNLINKDLQKFSEYEIYEIVKRSILREKIREIELKKYYKNLKLEKKFLENFMLNYFKRLNFNSLSDLNYFLEKNSLKLIDIEKKITIQLMWNELIFQKFSNRVKIDKELIKKKISSKKVQKEFLISEIVFNVNDKNELDIKYNLIKNEIKKNNFAKASIIYSISESSINGGKIGWVKENSLSAQIKNELGKTKIGEITKPISIPGAFIVLSLEDKRETESKFDIDKEVKEIIKKKTNEQLNQYSNIYLNKIKKSLTINEL